MTSLLIAWAVLTANPVTIDTWPGFRGDGSGVSPAQHLPARWTPEDGIAWRAAVAGYGQSAPVVWKDRVFVTSVVGPEQQRGLVHAYRLTDGRRLWTRGLMATQPLKNSTPLAYQGCDLRLRRPDPVRCGCRRRHAAAADGGNPDLRAERGLRRTRALKTIS